MLRGREAIGGETDIMPLVELAFSTLVLMCILFVHGAGTRRVNRHFATSWVHLRAATSQSRAGALLAVTVFLLIGLHLGETLLWAVPIWIFGLIPNARDSYYYVLESYTTLGEGAVSLPYSWRLVGPMIAMSGIFTIGWTTGILVGIMSDYRKLDADQAREAKDR